MIYGPWKGSWPLCRHLHCLSRAGMRVLWMQDHLPFVSVVLRLFVLFIVHQFNTTEFISEIWSIFLLGKNIYCRLDSTLTVSRVGYFCSLFIRSVSHVHLVSGRQILRLSFNDTGLVSSVRLPSSPPILYFDGSFRPSLALYFPEYWSDSSNLN